MIQKIRPHKLLELKDNYKSDSISEIIAAIQEENHLKYDCPACSGTGTETFIDNTKSSIKIPCKICAGYLKTSIEMEKVTGKDTYHPKGE